MKKFVLVHCGFEKPTPEIMSKWGEWFSAVEPNTVENLGFRGGREISKDGVRDLAMGPEAITGISIVEAEDLDAAQKLAETNPYISSIRVYEVMQKG